MTSYQDNPVKIAIVGDIHNQWEVEDAIALQELGVDLVLFVGDFGNEAVEVVRMIASVDLPKAAILGNHDAWYTASDWGRKRCPYDRNKD
jgi:predicted phosphodiesterase